MLTPGKIDIFLYSKEGESIIKELGLNDTISDAVRKHDWYKEYLKKNESGELDFIGKYDYNSSYKKLPVIFLKH